MTLDLPTLLVVATAVVLFSSVLFIVQAWARRGMLVDRLWSLAFLAAIITCLTLLALTVNPAMWWVLAVANAAYVLVPWAIWNGVRAYAGRPPLVWVSAAVAAVAGLSVLLGGQGGGPWAGGSVLLAGLAAGCLLAGWAIVTGPLRRFRSGVGLGVICTGAGLYYVVRLGMYLILGPESSLFTTYLGTELTTVVLLMLVNGAATSMVALRGEQGPAQAVHLTFDPATGARSPESFRARSRQELGSAAQRGQPVCLVLIRPEGAEAVRAAFGPAYAQQALATCGDVVQCLLPPRAVVGLDAAGTGFEVLLPEHNTDDGHEWAVGLRKEILSTPVEVPGTRLRLPVSVGLACSSRAGYDLDDLRAEGASAVREALEQGGNRVVAAAPASGSGDGGRDEQPDPVTWT